MNLRKIICEDGKRLEMVWDYVKWWSITSTGPSVDVTTMLKMIE
jgi:hypothetical protein